MKGKYNILFLAENQPVQSSGGTDRISLTLSAAFAGNGCRCFIAYFSPSSGADDNPGVTSFLLPEGEEVKTLSAFVQSNSIDFIISNLGGFRAKRLLLPQLYRMTRGTATRLIVCYHAMPGEDLYGNNIRNSLWRIVKKGSLSENLRNIFLEIAPRGVLKILSAGRMRSKYRLLYDNSDALVLLSSRFADSYATLAGVTADDRFRYMGNALSYDEFASAEDIVAKERQVLVLSRMDERSKRVSLALKAWKRICERPGSAGWSLKVVGGGPDVEYYRSMARRMHLERVSIEGRIEDVRPVYRESSIFMMTSAYEGWGITITEAQQFGVVPVAMNSFASLCETVTHGQNGLAVRDGDVNGMADAVVSLMSDDEKRKTMALQAVGSSRRFASDLMCLRWMDLLDSVAK